METEEGSENMDSDEGLEEIEASLRPVVRIRLKFLKEVLGIHKEPRLQISLRERTLVDAIKRLTSIPYCANYHWVLTDYVSAAREYKRFIEFIQESAEPFKSHLSKFLYPLFVYLYLDVLQSSGCKNAHGFFMEYVGIFSGSEGYDEYLKVLHNLSTVEEVENNLYFKKFWEMKFVVPVPEVVSKMLKDYLIEQSSLSLAKLLQLHFHIENPELSECSSESSIDTESDSEWKSTSEFNSKIEVKSDTGVKRGRGRGAVGGRGRGAVQAISKPPVSTDMHTTVFKFKEKRFTSVAVNKDETQIAFSTTDAYIYLKNIDPVCVDERHYFEYNERDFDAVLLYEEKEMYNVKYVPSESHQLLATSYRTVIMVNTQTLEIIRTYEGVHDVSIWTIEFNPEGTLFATASEDCTSCLFSVDPGVKHFIRRFVGHQESVNAVKFHPNEMYIATGSSDGTVRLHDITNAHLAQVYDCGKNDVYSLCFSVDGQFILSGNSDGYIRVFYIKNGQHIFKVAACAMLEKPLRHQRRPGRRVSGLCFNEDGKKLISVCSSGISRIWEISDLEKPVIRLLAEKLYCSTPTVLYYRLQNKKFKLFNLTS